MNGFATTRHQLRTAVRDEFETLVSDLLAGLLPRFVRSRRLGQLDCLGIDARQYDGDTDVTTLAVQCKGFELPFGADQLAQCEAEIEKYLRVGPNVPRYWMILNRRISAENRERLTGKAQTLVKHGKVSEARVFDEKQFTRHLRELACAAIAGWAVQRRAALKAEFVERLQVVAYTGPVPFRMNGPGSDPPQLITAAARRYFDEIHDEHYGRNRSPPRFLLSASFGFGKTSTLHEIAERWAEAGGNTIYIPAALLPGRAFGSSATLTEALLQEILPPDHEIIPQSLYLLRESFRRDMASSKDWLLLIDAIDECRNWEEHAALASLWGSIRDLGLPAVVSVREELFALRRSEFLNGDGTRFGEAFFQVLTLEDWPAPLIATFLQQYAADRSEPPHPEFSRLQVAVDSSDYETLYGDIPRRPLFLGMLAEDGWQGLQPERHLHRLYEQYFRRKLHADRYSAGAGGRPVRDGTIAAELGFEETVERMLLAMQAVAAHMATAGTAGTTLISEPDLKARIAEVMGTFGKTEEVALNSLLEPAGRDPDTRRRLFRFAHQSFQEWFTARWLVATATPEARNVEAHASAATIAFAIRMREDLIGAGDFA